MVKFILDHPVYLFLLFLSIFMIIKVIISIIHENPLNGDSEDDGGIAPEDPKLDLPPGVSLPEQERNVLV